MKKIEKAQSTFVTDTRLTVGILNIVAKIANNSVTTYKQRKEAGLSYLKITPKPTKTPEKPSH